MGFPAEEKTELVCESNPNICVDNDIKEYKEPVVKGWRTYSIDVTMFLLGLQVFTFIQINQEYLYYRFSNSPELPDAVREILNSDSGGDVEGCGSGGNMSSVANDLVAQVSSESSLFSTRLSLCRQIPTIIATMILCSYTDCVGRKVGILLPFVGGFCIALVYFLVEAYQASLNWLYLGNLLYGLAGGHILATGCLYAYISDVIPHDSQPFRFILAQSVYFSGSAVSGFLVGFLVDTYGFLTALGVHGVLYCIIILYVIFLLKEPLQELSSSLSIIKCFTNSWDALKIVFRPRKKKSEQYCLILSFFFVLMISITCLGNTDVLTVYAQGPPFCLSSTMIGYLVFVFAIGTVFLPPIGAAILKGCIKPSAFAAILTTIGLIGYICFALCVDSTQLFIGECSNSFTKFTNYSLLILHCL